MKEPEKLPFDVLRYGIFQALLLTAIIPGQARIVQVTCMALVAPISYHLITKTSTGDAAGDLGLGSALLTQILVALDLIFFRDPNTLKDLEDPAEESRKMITEQTFSRRLRWALTLYTNVRGIGWAHEPLHLPPRPAPQTTRRKFIWDRLFRVLGCGLLELVLTVLNASNPRMTADDVGLLSKYAWYWRVMGVLCFGVAGAVRIEGMYCLLSVAVVGCGFSSPRRWPNAFGTPLDAWSVQRFWRRVWHQNLRKSALGCTEFILSEILGLCPTSSGTKTLGKTLHIATKFARLYIAFAVTGLVHIGGEYMFLGKMGYGAFKFFALQAVGITLEKVVSVCFSGLFHQSPAVKGTTTADKKLTNANDHPKGINGCSGVRVSSVRPQNESNGNHHHPQDPIQTTNDKPDSDLLVRCIGYIWVILWFSWSASFMIDPMITTGMFVHPRLDLRTWFV